MKKYKAVIFDLDGTLVNSIDDLADSANAVLAEYGFPQHDVESYKYRVGNGIRKLMQRALPEDKQEMLDTALDRFKQIYAAHSLDKTAPYPGIKELLLSLKQKQIPIAICTNKHDEAAKDIVKILFGTIEFDQIIGDKPGLKRKPDPGKVLAIAANWNLQPEEIAYLGDSGVDMQTAVKADMMPVGVLWGFRKEDELLDNGAKVLLKAPPELLEKVSF